MEKLMTLLFAKIVCPQIKFHFSNEGSCFNPNTNCIQFNPTENAIGFLRHLTEFHRCDFSNDYSLKVWTILHEIGHYHTFEFSFEDAQMRAFLAFCDGSSVNIQNAYFNLDTEWKATEWAIDFIDEHSILCKCFSKILK